MILWAIPTAATIADASFVIEVKQENVASRALFTTKTRSL